MRFHKKWEVEEATIIAGKFSGGLNTRAGRGGHVAALVRVAKLARELWSSVELLCRRGRARES